MPAEQWSAEGARIAAEIKMVAEAEGVDLTTANCYGGSRLVLDNARTTDGSYGVITTLNAYPGSYQANAGNFDNYVTTLNQWVGSTQAFNQPNAKTTVATTTPKGQK